MKRNVTRFVCQCMTCHQIKVEHKRLGRFLQSLEILEWKWDHSIMDNDIGLPRSSKGHDTILVIVDCLTKCTQVLPTQKIDSLCRLSHLYIQEIVRLH